MLMAKKVDLLNLSLSEIDSFLAELGLKGYRSSQVKRWIFKEGVISFSQMSNLSKSWRSLLDEKAILRRLKIDKVLSSRDGTKKYIFNVGEKDEKRLDRNVPSIDRRGSVTPLKGFAGRNFIESVLIPDKNRLTLCLSTQVGCRMGCKFCFTGEGGLYRNLEPSEIINQILEVQRDINKNFRISNLVIMGMGEPLDNFENVKKAITTIIDKDGFDFSPRRVTLSTCGIIPGIKSLKESGLNINLAVSLNASSDEKRESLMPVNRAFPLEDLIRVARDYPLQKRGRVTFEYLLINGINDGIEDAKNLIEILKGVKAKINLLNFNSFPGSKYSPSSPARVLEFQNFLKAKNFTVNLRKSRGSDILAACGQLGGIGCLSPG